MTALEVSAIIAREIAEDWYVSNWHGVALPNCLVEPVKRFYENSFQAGEWLELWLVLEENPSTKAGYKIVFDEAKGWFGLAIGGQTQDVFIGYYGTFRETLEGM